MPTAGANIPVISAHR